MKRILAILSASLIVCLCFVWGRSAALGNLMKHASYGLRRAEQTGSVGSLFVGSSMFQKGIDGRVFSEKDSPAYVLGFNGNQPCMEAFELQWLLDHGVKIDSLYVDMYCYSAAAAPALSDVRLLRGLSLKDQTELFRVFQANDSYGAQEFFEMIVQANNEAFLTYPIYGSLVNARFEAGTNLGVTAGLSMDAVSEIEIASFHGFSEELNPDQAAGIQKMISLCRENNISLVFVETPKHARLYQETTYPVMMQNYIDFLSENHCDMILCSETARSCGVNASEGSGIRTYAFDNRFSEHYSDLIHLSTSGKAVFSEGLQKMLQGQ